MNAQPMSRTRDRVDRLLQPRHPLGIGLAGLALMTVALAGVALGGVLAGKGQADTFYGSLRLFVGWSFIGVGIYEWWRRSSSLIGPLMIATGFFWFLTDLAYYGSPTVYTLLSVVGVMYHATTIHLLLAFPSGRLETAATRRAAIAGYVIFFVANLLVYLVADVRTEFDCSACSENVLQVTHNTALADVVIVGGNLIAAALVAYVLASLVLNWHRSQGWRRRAYVPLLFSGLATAFLLELTLLTLAFKLTHLDTVFEVGTAAFATVPFSYLIGLLRSRMLGGDAVGNLAARIGEARDWSEVQEVVRVALGDPSLELGCRQSPSEPYMGVDGQPLERPQAGSSRALAPVEIDGTVGAAFLYDADIVDDPALVDAATAAAGVAMHKYRLEVELRTNLEELRASRERIVEAGYDERRRLERNLHDGAQQRLVSLALELRLARAKLGSDPGEASEMLDSIGIELELALAELRELARGIHPAILSDRGLEAALDSLAARSPFEVKVEAVPDGRLPEKIESAAYFVISEALANAIKHSRASHAFVRVKRENGRVAVEVADDGVGGADPSKGSGLRGLLDRVSALEGRLEVDSRSGDGTTVRASIPCE
jgi:signal transduction histidine kinase